VVILKSLLCTALVDRGAVIRGGLRKTNEEKGGEKEEAEKGF